MNQSKLVSIILPIYNAENTLNRCLSSLKRQTYDNIEVLMLDDGSTDSSKDICKTYENADARFKLFSLSRLKSVAKVRNIGLENYTGDYLMFADADDMVSDNYVERLLEVLNDSGCSIATCIAHDTADTTVEHYAYHSHSPVKMISLTEYDFTKPWSHRVVWGAIFTRDVIGDTRFNESYHSSTDTLFMATILSKETTIAHINEPLYVYIYYPDSISHRKYDWKRFSDIEVWENIAYDIFRSSPEVPAQSSRMELLRRCAVGIREVSLLPDRDTKLLDELIRRFRRCYRSLTSFGGLGIRERLKFSLIDRLPSVYINLLKYRNRTNRP